MFHSSALEDVKQKNTILEEIICINNDLASEYSLNLVVFLLFIFSPNSCDFSLTWKNLHPLSHINVYVPLIYC